MTEKRPHNEQLSEPHSKVSKCMQAGCLQQLLSEGATDKLQKAWLSKESLQIESCGAELHQKPFCHAVIPNFVDSPAFLEDLEAELDLLEFREKNNDLYKFEQSKEDLKSATSPCVAEFRKLMCETFKPWLVQVTGIPLNDTVDMFCAKYRYTDTLCCHDDELEGRRIAYIFYLVKSWTKEDGGCLDLYSVDDNIQPTEVVKSILPVRNNMVFFEVCPGSYHQVAEILSEDKCRLSIGGWFHGPPIQRPSPFLEAPRPLKHYGSIDDDVFFDWINPVYLSVQAQGSIQEKFEADSEIELQDFLTKEKYEELLTALRGVNAWREKGPPNKRCYDQLEEDSAPDPVKTVRQLLESDAVFLILSNLTGLKLHELADSASESEEEEEEEEEEDSNQQSSMPKERGSKCSARCRVDVRRWRHGCYTLVHDTDTEGCQFALDLVLYIGSQGWDDECGGFTSYIAKGEDEELLTVTPSDNSLALVYRDKDSLRFVKHINHRINKLPNKAFYDIAAVYYE